MYAPDKLADLISQPVVPKPYTLDSLIAWLRTKPEGEEYNAMCTDGHCLVGQYSAAHGYGHLLYHQQADMFKKVAGKLPIGPGYQHAVYLRIYSGYPRTFGAALSRALAIAGRGA